MPGAVTSFSVLEGLYPQESKQSVTIFFVSKKMTADINRGKAFPARLYVHPAKIQISLRILAG